MDESLLKSNFIGRDGFRWWVGQIPPIESQGKQVNGGGWGNRYKVRIMGYHPYSLAELPNEDLPWAQCLIPTTAGSGGANYATDVKLQPGDVVFGFFLDGDNAQLPVIMGCFGRTSQVPSNTYVSPFIPFTGFTDNIKDPGKTTLPKGESNEANAESQKSPRYVSPAQANAIGNNEVSYFYGIGDKLQLASGSGGTAIDKISNEIENLLKGIQNGIGLFLNLDNEIKKVVNKIKGIVSGLVGGIINDLYKQLTPILNEGLKLLYDEIYGLVLSATGGNIPIATAAGIAAQKALAEPVKALQDGISSAIYCTVSGIEDSLVNILTALINNAERFSSCAGIQFAAAVINDIIGKIVDDLENPINGVSSILKFFSNFSTSNTIRNSVNGISGFSQILSACQAPTNYDGGQVKQWIVGSGPANAPQTPFSDILKNANVAQAIALVDGVLSAYSIFNSSTANPNSSCYTGPPTNCSPPTVTFFGGNGIGAEAELIFGSVVNDIAGKTGSIIGLKITNPGSGYTYPPFISINDNCNQGYGAIAYSIIDNGEVTGAYIISPGENYPVGEQPPYVVNNVIVQNQGTNYSANDTVTDNFGNTYSIQVSSNGNILNVLPLNNSNVVTDLPTFKINTSTGYGAILRSSLDIQKPPQGKVIQSIDCVSP
jgi:hypothetical protein